MKSLQIVFSIGLVLALSGCAHTGYQRSYAGYNSGYSSGYTVQRYSDYPERSYYRQGGQYYTAPVYQYDHHDQDRHNDWRGMDHQRDRREHPEHGSLNRWEGRSALQRQPSHDGQVESAPTRAWATQGQNQRRMGDVGISRQPTREFNNSGFNRPGNEGRRSDDRHSDEGSNRHGHDHWRH